MYSSVPKDEMNKLELILNNPEWVSVFASGVFAVVTIGIIWRQVCVMQAQVRVMQWQGRNSSRHERIQNQLLRLQHEHEWLLRLNAERERLLESARALHLAASCLKEEQSNADAQNWGEVQDIANELHRRLDILDFTVFTGQYDQWYASLDDYVEAVLAAVSEDYDFKKTYDVKRRRSSRSIREKITASSGRTVRAWENLSEHGISNSHGVLRL